MKRVWGSPEKHPELCRLCVTLKGLRWYLQTSQGKRWQGIPLIDEHGVDGKQTSSSLAWRPLPGKHCPDIYSWGVYFVILKKRAWTCKFLRSLLVRKLENLFFFPIKLGFSHLLALGLSANSWNKYQRALWNFSWFHWFIMERHWFLLNICSDVHLV